MLIFNLMCGHQDCNEKIYRIKSASLAVLVLRLTVEEYRVEREQLVRMADQRNYNIEWQTRGIIILLKCKVFGFIK